MESSETPINPYRVIGDLMKVLDPKNSFVTADSGNTRDQTSTVYEAQIPRGHLGWGNVSTLGFSLAGAVGAKLAFPDRQCVHVTGDAGVCYMMGNFEAVARYKIGITTLHINNGGYSGYGPGFWGAGLIRSRGRCPITSPRACRPWPRPSASTPRTSRNPVRSCPRCIGRSTRTPRVVRRSSNSSALTIRSTAAGSARGRALTSGRPRDGATDADH